MRLPILAPCLVVLIFATCYCLPRPEPLNDNIAPPPPELVSNAASSSPTPLDDEAAEPSPSSQQQNDVPSSQQQNLEGPTPLNAPPILDDGVPPGFAGVLPSDVIQKLKSLQSNLELSFPEKQAEFDRILNSVDPATLAKLPFPPGFEGLPENVKEKIKEIHTNTEMSWNEKSKQIGKIIESLPPNLKAFLPEGPPGINGGKRINFPPMPPPGFKEVLPADTYAQLLQVHQDANLTPKEKIHKIDTIMRSLPQEVLDKLPLPPGFAQLPPETVEKARAIFADKTLDYEAKNKKIIAFVKSLPEEQRQLVKPPLPPVLSQLSEEVRDKIEAIFENENLNEEERHAEFWKLVNNLPENLKDKKKQIHRDLGDGSEPGAPSSNPGVNAEGPFADNASENLNENDQ
ncbi:hypothetical protein DdX_09791 [Ditylenchus destructor]|uniref:Uncharacterized protein n=1 Tax=Ditylenchus destructor TaxID=166010 RepID=A0AAD4N227_9BILA|nr:hypothetical protein DdX_09791 [Ditylenchus destructor]